MLGRFDIRGSTDLGCCRIIFGDECNRYAIRKMRLTKRCARVTIARHQNGRFEKLMVRHQNGRFEKLMVRHQNGRFEKLMVRHQNGRSEKLMVRR